MSTATSDPYGLLIAGICRQAAKDLRATRYDKARNKTVPNYRMRRDAERFFLSDWFYELTGLDGKTIINKLSAMNSKSSKGKE